MVYKVVVWDGTQVEGEQQGRVPEAAAGAGRHPVRGQTRLAGRLGEEFLQEAQAKPFPKADRFTRLAENWGQGHPTIPRPTDGITDAGAKFDAWIFPERTEWTPWTPGASRTGRRAGASRSTRVSRTSRVFRITGRSPRTPRTTRISRSLRVSRTTWAPRSPRVARTTRAKRLFIQRFAGAGDRRSAPARPFNIDAHCGETSADSPPHRRELWARREERHRIGLCIFGRRSLPRLHQRG